VQGKHPKFGGETVAGRSGLALRNTMRNHDIAEIPRLIRRKGQDIRG